MTVHTFSQLVDHLTSTLARPDLADLVAGQLNLTIRELFSTDRHTPVFYDRQRIEEQVAATTENGFVYDLPNPYLFQAIETIRYDTVLDFNGHPIYPVKVNPGRQVNNEDYFYYRTGDSIAMVGYGGIDALISISRFEFLPSLQYYSDPATRPAEFTIENGWTYLASFDIDDTTRANARALVSNWMLFGWGELVAEGVRAKIYKLESDDARSRVSFSLYQSLRESLYRAESASSLQQ